MKLPKTAGLSIILLALTAQPVLAQLVSAQAADAMLQEFATPEIVRCATPAQQNEMPLADVIEACGGAVDQLDERRASIPSTDAGHLGVLDMLQAMLAGGVARRFLEADGETTHRTCVAMVKQWRALNRIQSSAFEPGYAAQINSMREAAWDPAYKCRQAYPDLE